MYSMDELIAGFQDERKKVDIVENKLIMDKKNKDCINSLNALKGCVDEMVVILGNKDVSKRRTQIHYPQNIFERAKIDECDNIKEYTQLLKKKSIDVDFLDEFMSSIPKYTGYYVELPTASTPPKIMATWSAWDKIHRE